MKITIWELLPDETLWLSKKQKRIPHASAALTHGGATRREALWAAYRRYDKSAVTKKVLRHYLPKLARIRGRNAAGAGREPVRNKIILGHDLSDSRSGGKKSTQANRTRGKNLLRLISKPGKDKHGHASGLKTSR